MTTNFELSAKARTEKGKGASRRLRRLADLTPAIVYGAGKDSASITLAHKDVVKALKNESFYTQIIKLDIDGKAEQVVVKDIQRHPFKPLIMHMDFLRIKAGEKITMQVPLHFIGEDVAPGLKQGGGIFSHLVTEVEIICLPKDLPEFIEVDVSNLELDQLLHLSDIKASDAITFNALAHDNDLAIVSIHKPRGVAEDDEEQSDDAESSEAKADGKADTKDKE
jgi:large subunit ribosomal protein L25